MNMKRLHLLTNIAAIIIAVLLLNQPASSQSAGDCIQLLINGDEVYASDACTVAPTPTPTSEPPTPTPTPEPGHDVTVWHPPGDYHHHGADPSTSSLYGDFITHTGQQIAFPWVSHPTENIFPYPDGKHEGFKYLMESDTDCDNFGGSDNNCVKSYLLQVHSIGTNDAIYTRYHSQAGAFEVCTRDLTQCGVVFTGGLADYGMLHRGYKVDYCRLPGDPGLTLELIDQPPYRTGTRLSSSGPRDETVNPQFWSSLGPNPIVQSYYPDGDLEPNYLLQLAWSAHDAWDYMVDDPDLCSDPAEAIDFDGNHSKFKVHTIRLDIDGFPRPFSGFTNVWGHVDDTCTEASAECVPLYIGPDVPAGDAVLNRSVNRDCGGEAGPCFEFDDGTPLRKPGS